MSSGEWCKGQTKETSERIKRMASNVSAALNDPNLRKRLDDQKRLSADEILQKIQASNTDWVLKSDLSNYTKQNEKNLLCVCQQGHERLISLIDITNNVKCKTCHPKRNTGRLNPAFKGVNVFLDSLLKKFNEDAFMFDASKYNGVYTPIEFTCIKCMHVFTKAPRVLLNEKFGCPKCAELHRKNNLSRTRNEFEFQARRLYGDSFTYYPTIDQKYGNADYISRTCNVCNVTQTQSIGSHLTGEHGCGNCSQKMHHTTESFIKKSKIIYGDKTFDYSLVSYANNKQYVTLKCNKENHTFSCSPSNHFVGRGCPHCLTRKNVSMGETEWLDSLNVPVSNRNVFITANGQKFNVDALINHTVYEYYGDFWHGNPQKYNPSDLNPRAGMTMGELYEHTMIRKQLLNEAGYVVIAMWELDWMKLRNTRPKGRI